MVQQQNKTLIQVDAAYKALAEAKTLEDALDIRDKVSAVQIYLKVHSQGLDAQNDAAKVKLRAERRLGEILAEMDRQGPGRPTADRNAPTLGELNIGHSESSRWQLEARVSEQEFQAWLVQMVAKNKEITSAGLLRLARGMVGEREEKQRDDSQSEFVTFSFRVPRADAGEVDDALRAASRISGSMEPGVNLVGICRDFLAGVSSEEEEEDA